MNGRIELVPGWRFGFHDRAGAERDVLEDEQTVFVRYRGLDAAVRIGQPVLGPFERSPGLRRIERGGIPLLDGKPDCTRAIRKLLARIAASGGEVVALGVEFEPLRRFGLNGVVALVLLQLIARLSALICRDGGYLLVGRGIVDVVGCTSIRVLVVAGGEFGIRRIPPRLVRRSTVLKLIP